MIEGKLQEIHEVNNVQVVIAEATVTKMKLLLLDDGGVFLETDVCRCLAKG